jgi:transcription initiation factor TFIIE subunit alpha
MEASFICPVDESPLMHFDNTEEKQALRNRIDALKQTMAQ